MAADVVILLAALAASPIGLLWVEWHRRNDDKKARQASCYHYWGDPVRVARTAFYTQFCKRCQLQRHCNSDGTPYEPRR